MTKAQATVAMTWGLRVFGTVTLLAVGGLLMPHAWMDATHRFIGLGELPALPIVKYLTRSCSALYMYLGALFLYLSLDPVARLAQIRFCAKCGLVFAVTDATLGALAGLPPWWWIGSGLIVSTYCATALFLARKMAGN